MSLDERAAAPGPAETGSIDRSLAETREQRWREQTGLDDEALFLDRLGLAGLDRERFLRLLVEHAESLRERCPRPSWMDVLERCWTSESPVEMPLDAVEHTPHKGFLRIFQPLLSHAYARACRRIEEIAARCEDTPPFDPAAVVPLLVGKLPMLLLLRCSRPLNLELRIAGLEERLHGDTPEARFESFVESLGDPDTARAILDRHPVLARSAVLRIEQWETTRIELLERLVADRDALSKTFLDGQDLGRVVEIDDELSDRHAGGRTVAILRFDSGFRIVYKPRSLQAEARFQELLSAVGDFRTVQVLDRGDYGWMEHVVPSACTSHAEVERFYRRQGALLALLYALDATDIHHENLIACGEHPVLIDLETLFQPIVPGEEELHNDVQFAVGTVLRSGLLPRRGYGSDDRLDLTGLGATRGQTTRFHDVEHAGTDRMQHVQKDAELPSGAHLPDLATEPNALEGPWSYVDQIVEGFRRMYRDLSSRKDELTAPDGALHRLAEAEMRALLRATELYVRLRFATGHPDVSQDGLARDRLLDKLWRGVRRNPAMQPVVGSELASLRRGDVPHFKFFPRSRDLHDSDGRTWKNFFSETGWRRVNRRLAAMGPDDLERQTYLVRQSLRASRPPGALQPRARHEIPRDREPVETLDLIAEARRVGERLETLAVRHGRHVSWFHLRLGSDLIRRFEPVGADLYHGLSGIALFFAYLAVYTEESRFERWARQCMDRLRPETNLGAYGDLGGVIYASTHLGALWQEPALWDRAEELTQEIPEAVEEDESFDVVVGSAGILAVVLGLYRRRPSDAVLKVAIACGDHLLRRGRRNERGLGWPVPAGGDLPLTGFGHGTAGIAWALAELASVTREPRFEEAVEAALDYERSWFSPEENNWPDLREDRQEAGDWAYHNAWCHGAPGIGLGRVGTLELTEDPDEKELLRREIRAAVETTLESGFGDSHCLCHGDLGNLDFVWTAARALQDPELIDKVTRLSAGVLASLRTGWKCGVSAGGEPPGLMTGLAGLGYGLLRLADPDHVPSVLLPGGLEAP